MSRLKGTSTVAEALRERVERVEEALHALLPHPSAFPEVIHESMRYSTLGGGKRLRAVLLMEAAALVSALPAARRVSPDEASVHITPELMRSVGAAPAAGAAVEMVHAFSLIHDDLPCMDDDDLRRGKPTNHKVYGEGIAVLAGDGLLARAFEVTARLPWAGTDHQTAALVTAELAMAVGSGGIVGGQVADIQAESRSFDDSSLDSHETLAYIHAHKTGALFVASLRIGGIIGGMTPDELAQLTSFGESIGLVFQIVDDILDVEGEASAMGKNVGGDEERGKLTYPALYGLDASKRRVAEEMERAGSALDVFGEKAAFLRALAEAMALRRS